MDEAGKYIEIYVSDKFGPTWMGYCPHKTEMIISWICEIYNSCAFKNILITLLLSTLIILLSFLKDVTKHDKYVWKIIKKLMKAGIMLNIKKCKFDTIKINLQASRLPQNTT